MSEPPLSRRRLLGASAAALGSLTGCLSTDESPATERRPTATETTTQSTDETATPTQSAESSRVEGLSVADYILYPLASVHPHVHSEANTQYVVVRLRADSSDRAAEGLSLVLDGEPVSRAERQPVPWTNDTDDIAFAVSKSETVEQGAVLVDGTSHWSLRDETITRLNNPPVFELSDHSLTPTALSPDEAADATVRFTVSNTGSGSGTFGASLSGNFLSGSNTVTETVDAGSQQELNPSVRVVGSGDEATVNLDWGTDEWTGTIPVESGET